MFTPRHVRRPLALAVTLALTLPGTLRAETEIDKTKTQSESDQTEIPTVEVIGSRIRLQQLPGSGEILDEKVFKESRPFTINEVLRKVPGVYVREEEGAGLRPNIGIRGLNPTRSAKVLLLEDGLPLTFAPYGGNETYYHPPVERFSRAEVLKGSGQIAFGPHTVGGVINYITPTPPSEASGRVRLAAGNRGFKEAYVEAGTTEDNTGVLVQGLSKTTEGARDNMEFDVKDYNVKLVHEFSDTQAITLRASSYDEKSNVPYSGLTLAEWNTFGSDYNPFVNDRYEADRWALSATHEIAFNSDLTLKTSIYRTDFSRDWWRQSSNSNQRPNDSSDPVCGGMANLSTRCGNEGRLRDYQTWGVEPRFSLNHGLFGAENTLEFGLRAHFEEQKRLQWNGDTPNARTPGTSRNAGVREDNRRDVDAYSGFVQNAFAFGDWTVTPGVRFEDIGYERENKLKGAEGEESLDELLGGLGVNYALSENTHIYGGVHEGFSPPNVQDVINDNGGSVDLAAEESLNWELGVRSTPMAGLRLEATWFRMDFDNQIIPASLAGGSGSTLTSAGETLHEGFEALAEWNSDEDFTRGELNWFGRASATWLDKAEFRGTRYSSITPSVDVSGNRLPYAPEQSFVGGLGLEGAGGWGLMAELVYVSEAYTDDLNTRAVTANGQRGQIDSYSLWNLTGNWTVPNTGWTVYVSGKNLGDKEYVADMTRGLIPGMPRLVQAGVEYAF